MGDIVVRHLDAAGLDAGLDDLARILADCVTLGYRSVGAIPEFARDAFAPRYESTTLMWKKITR